MKIIFDKKLGNVKIESDSLTAVNLINEGNPGNHSQSVVINEAHYLMNRTNTSLSHIYRSIDQCADHLARVGTEQDEDLVVLAKMPIFIREFVIRDSLNLMQVLD